MSNTIAVFDLGGTHTRVALADARGIHAVSIFPTDTRKKPFEELAARLRKLAEDRPVSAVVGGVAGYIDPQTEVLVSAPNLSSWCGVSPAGELSKALGVPAHVINDTAVVGLGEVTEGLQRRVSAAAYLTISTGVNAVLIRDGNLLPGRGTPEIGRTVVGQLYGRLVTLEEVIGGAAFQRRYGRHPHEVREPEVWRQEAILTAVGIRNLIMHWMPDAVILGGSMTVDIDLAVVRKELEDVRAQLGWLPVLTRSRLGDRAGLMGARRYAQTLGWLPKAGN